MPPKVAVAKGPNPKSSKKRARSARKKNLKRKAKMSAKNGPVPRKDRKVKVKGKGGAKKPDLTLIHKLAGQFKAERKRQCLEPIENIINGVSDGLFNRVIRIIDEFIFRIMVDTPSVFMCRNNNNDPLIPINVLRGAWWLAFMQYMFRCKCLSSDWIGPQSIGNLKIPLGLAKAFQQFAPYDDPNSGSKFRFDVGVINPVLNTTYPSVDAYTSGAASTNLNAPLLRHMIHPSRFDSSNVDL